MLLPFWTQYFPVEQPFLAHAGLVRKRVQGLAELYMVSFLSCSLVEG